MTESLEDFLHRLAEASPAPGGGSAAALCGAVASALAGMVAGLAIGKSGYEDRQADLRDLTLRAEALRRRFTELVTLDEDAFVNVALAYKMPKGSDAERAKRKAAIQEALREATVVPLETMERAVEALVVAREALGKGARSAFTDAGAAGLIAEACLRAARLNVSVNLASIEDVAFRAENERKSEALAARASAMAAEIAEDVRGRL
jgi:formiminotetrahydrofolate cyclodeaminase